MEPTVNSNNFKFLNNLSPGLYVSYMSFELTIPNIVVAFSSH